MVKIIENPMIKWRDAVEMLVRLKEAQPEQDKHFVVVEDHKGKKWMLAVAEMPNG